MLTPLGNGGVSGYVRGSDEPLARYGARWVQNRRTYSTVGPLAVRPAERVIRRPERQRREQLLPESDTARRRPGIAGHESPRTTQLLTGWANYFTLGQVSPAYVAIDRHATRRLRQWLCRKHKVRAGKVVRYPADRLWSDYGLTHLAPRTASFPWAKA